MAVRYTVTDSAGVVHTRTSRRHLEPHYPFAVVRRPGNSCKFHVSYHGTLQMAQAALHSARGQTLGGKPYYPGAALYEVTAEVL